eukprot:1746103-Prymnesium_polylepis.1
MECHLPDVAFAARLGDDALVLGRAAGLRAAAHGQRARRREVRALLVLQRRLDEHGRRRLVDDLGRAVLDVLVGGELVGARRR